MFRFVLFILFIAAGITILFRWVIPALKRVKSKENTELSKFDHMVDAEIEKDKKDLEKFDKDLKKSSK